MCSHRRDVQFDSQHTATCRLQGLCEDVSRQQVRTNVLQVDISNKDLLLDEVVVHLDVFGLSMEDKVPSKVNTTHHVAVEENRILYVNAHILKYRFQPNGFT